MLSRFLTATLSLALVLGAGDPASSSSRGGPALAYSSTAAEASDPLSLPSRHLDFGVGRRRLDTLPTAADFAPVFVAQAQLEWPKGLSFPEDGTARLSDVKLELPLAHSAQSTGADIAMHPEGFEVGGGSDARIWKAYIPSYSALKREAGHLKSSPPRTLRGETDLACLAVAIYHEARDQSMHGKLAVASVIQSRAQVPDRWGDDACEVVRPVQFSFMTTRYGFPPIHEVGPWHDAVDVALKSLIDGPLPELHGADHYHATYVKPDWRLKMVRVGRIGAHIFYRDPTSPQV